MRIITNQITAYNKTPLDGLHLHQDPDDSLNVNFTLIGPKETPWEDLLIKGNINIPSNYPFVPPEPKFITKTYHPNIYPDGKVCLSILNSVQDETGYFKETELWTPALGITQVFLCILNLFTEPNLDSPANLDAKILYQTDIKSFTKMIRKEIKQ
jgi:ubiquitin-protein ligase